MTTITSVPLGTASFRISVDNGRNMSQKVPDSRFLVETYQVHFLDQQRLS